MKVLLNGGLGFIGKRFIRKFYKVHEIVVYARKESIEKEKGKPYLNNVIIKEGNTVDSKLCQIIDKIKPDIVVHLAALSGLRKCQNNPDLAFRTNVYGTYNVIRSCLNSKTRLVFISSREVYGETKNDKSCEEDALLPKNVYGVSKMIGENLIKLHSDLYDLDYTILRVTNVYGPEGDQYGAQIIIKDAIRQGKIKILGGEQRLNYVYVDDVVDTINLVLNNKSASRQIFNIGSFDNLSVKEFVKKVIELVGTDIKIEYHPMRETEANNFVPDITKLEKKLGFTPSTSLSQGIKNIIEWYTNN